MTRPRHRRGGLEKHGSLRLQCLFGLAAPDVKLAVRSRPRSCRPVRDEHLLDMRQGCQRRFAADRSVGRHPAEAATIRPCASSADFQRRTRHAPAVPRRATGTAARRHTARPAQSRTQTPLRGRKASGFLNNRPQPSPDSRRRRSRRVRHARSEPIAFCTSVWLG